MKYYSKTMLKIRQWVIKYTDIEHVTNKGIIIAALIAIIILIAAAYILTISAPVNM